MKTCTRSHRMTLVAWIAVLAGAAGCSPTDTAQQPTTTVAQTGNHESHDYSSGDKLEFETFGRALEYVADVKDTISKAFADGKPDDVHHLLHDIGHVLQELPGLATKGRELTSVQTAAMNQAVEALFDGFSKFDDQMHGGEAVDVTKTVAEIDQAIAQLEESMR